ncbi:homoserine dehydrogenase [Solitalea sp. MAHUQ-68]|uniref:Homoserine dehydrogenase n=1 Tax=Solitalea agri TaxID=2953739 RepID=A0A9X2EZG2_9SPHI|nr:homoserine dehydrogenase [Solitalea agri]MCO4291396.1 homoserine dehydrogenase [Solitalea agri]
MSTKIKLGLFGFGCVGQGLYNVLNQTEGIKAEIVKICIKNPNKKRSLSADYFTLEKDEILFNEDINVVVEMIDDAEAAFQIVKTALQNGKAVVSANKKMIADHFDELYQLQKQYNAPLLYEASACASIPIIRNLEEYYDNDLLGAVEGIFNGSTNYILTKIFKDNIDFDTALKQAQEIGFAETDPTLDVEAYDPKYKLCIILAHTFGLFVKPEEVFNYGIQNLSTFDIQYANEKGYKIKLIAFCRKVDNKIVAGVLPRFIKPDNKLYNIENEYNGILVESAFTESQFFAGKGAGSNPTGSAVLSDISALTYSYKYEYKKHNRGAKVELTDDFSIDLYVRYSTANPIDTKLFTNIKESYANHESAYIVGSINFAALRQSDLIKRKDINLIVAADTKFEKLQNSIQSLEEETVAL